MKVFCANVGQVLDKNSLIIAWLCLFCHVQYRIPCAFPLCLWYPDFRNIFPVAPQLLIGNVQGFSSLVLIIYMKIEAFS